jgi:RNA polymerase sigma factor (sigma-70 family)
MTNATAQPFTDHMQVLFGVGTCAGMSDGQLLERFLAGRDEAGDLAFEALAARHGPMVMRVCRNVLDDPHDVHDAFQAVFLVLARRATAIRDRQSVGSWLHGVAMRVCARARVAAIRRQIRDRRTIGAAQTLAAAVSNQDDVSPLERNDQAEVVHEELSRLPEKYRTPVVLCYLEGLTHDEAAARLSWPVGTVRSRLARARDRLRNRLSCRGVAAPASIGPMASWLVGESGASSKLIATVSSASSAPIARELLTSILQGVSRQAVGRTTAAASVPSTSMLLAQGVLESMMFKKLMIAACMFLPIALTTVAGGVLLARRTQAQVQKPSAAGSVPKVPQATTKEPLPTDDIDRLAQQLLEAARKRLDAQKAYYEEGRITLDRFVDASKQLEIAELRLAKIDADRLAVRQRHVDLLKEIENREKAELAVGRGTVADVAEAHERRLEAELDLKLSQRETSELAALLRRLNELERKVEQLQKERAGK